ncbi:AAA family ATPase, partial [Patescibacteria group bacterium]|nr:AAA family ATPase [Patescibacteria group bacterium]
GHKYLIDTAVSQAERVVVLVTDTPQLNIPAEIRAGWLQEIHPGVDVQIIPDICRDNDSRAWAKHTIKFLGYKPDAVFTSEDYGEPWAKYLGCAHVCVDQVRQTWPISGTKVRANPLASWEYLEPPVRAHYAKRICVLGAESTGTTTLARSLAEHYNTTWVPEYGRFFSEGKYTAPAFEWQSAEFVHIAEQQARLEDWLARSANRVLICDTDPFTTSIWHERYLGEPSPEVVALAERRHYDLYILTGDEIPFVQDGLRDGEHIRHQMHCRFERALRETNRPYIKVTGTRNMRLKEAVKIIDSTIWSEKKQLSTKTSKSLSTRSSLRFAAVN